MFFSSRQAGCGNFRQQRPNLFLKSSLKGVPILNEQLNSTLAILTNVIESQTLQGLYSVLV